MNQYVDGEIEPGVCEAFEHHLKGCNPCQVVVDNIRQTIQLYNGEPYDIPPELHEHLSDLLWAKWKAKFPAAVRLEARRTLT